MQRGTKKTFEINKFYQGDAITVLKTFPNESINCCVTSPPYWSLRDYGVEGQIGLEKTPEKYAEKLVAIFSEVKRVLKSDGTLWLNLGDSYATPKVGNTYGLSTSAFGKSKYSEALQNQKFEKKLAPGYKSKDLIGIPWLVAFALRSAGWYLRQDIIWHKPNPMPESVTDRCTKSHEYIFLLSKSQKYYYNQEAIKEKTLTFNNSNRDRDNTKLNNTPGRTLMKGLKTNQYEKANKRSVWTVSTKPFTDAHFATFPEKLIVDMIKAGCPKGGIVLDPFMGAGTTAIVARRQEKNFIGIELNPEYIKIAEKRRNKLGFFR